MKIRKSFVSNSSSCSFVVAGILADIDNLGLKNNNDSGKWDWFDKLQDTLDYDIFAGDENGVSEGKVLIGKELAKSSDEYMDTSVHGIKDILFMMDDILSKIGTGEKVIYCGTRMC